MARKNPYQTLGVESTASAEEIKNSYRNLAKKFHPDLNPGNKEAEKKFQELSAAYEIVGEAENRAKFDRGEWEEPGQGATQHQRQRRAGPFYRDTRAGGGGGERYGFSFEGGGDDLFEQLFRGRGEPEPERYQLEVNLREAILGGERELSLPSGKRLRVKIPAGVAEGVTLRFAGQGSSKGGAPGDVLVELRVRPDPRFELHGNDLVYRLALPLATAMLGGEARVPTPEGELLLQVPKLSSSGRRLRVPQKGIFARGTQKRGDLLVEIQVALPEAVDSELESALRAWQERHPEASQGRSVP